MINGMKSPEIRLTATSVSVFRGPESPERSGVIIRGIKKRILQPFRGNISPATVLCGMKWVTTGLQVVWTMLLLFPDTISEPHPLRTALTSILQLQNRRLWDIRTTSKEAHFMVM